MKQKILQVVHWGRAHALVCALLGSAGLVINCLPIETFPGVHLIFGSALGLFAGLRYGPAAGAIVGFIAGLPTVWLWNQPFPFSALLHSLEGAWVGLMTRRVRRGPLAAALMYWLFLGSWLSLFGHLLVFKVPILPAFIIQARAIINGMLAGLALEIVLYGYEIYKKLKPGAAEQPARLSLDSLVTIVLATVISVPLLYISSANVRAISERMMTDLVASSRRDVESVESEVGALLENYKRGIVVAVSTISPAHHVKDTEALARLLKAVRKQYPEFAGMYVADAGARTIAFDPSHNEDGESLVGLDYSDRQYYRDLVATRATVFSGVYQARGGMSDPTVAIGEPILDERGNFSGFVLGWFDLKSFQRIVSRYRGEGRTLVISDADGRLIADSSMEPGAYKEVTFAQARDFKLVKTQQSDTVDYFEQSREASPLAMSGASDQISLTLTTMPLTDWKVWNRQSFAPVRSRLEKLYLNQVVVLLFSLLVALVLGKLVARLLTKPISEIQRTAERLSAGNLSDRPVSRRLVTAELDSLYRSFRRMAANLEASWDRQHELLREVSSAKGEWEATFDAMADVVVITDNDDRIIRANRAFYQMFQVEPGTGAGKPFTDLVHPKGNWEDCDICRVRREGMQAYVMSPPERNTSSKHLAIRVDPVYNHEGERIGRVQVIRDLSAVRKAEAEAEKAGALLRNLVDAAYDAVYATDLEGRLLWANKRAATLFGFSEPLQGKSILQGVHPDDLERVRATFDAVVGGEAQKYEMRYLTSDDVRHVLVTNSPVYMDGEVITVLGIARDFTEDRLIAEQTSRNDKLRALGQLASGVAHNFNNSLTAVIGYTQMVLGKLKDPIITKHLKTVETAALDAAKMVQRIQNFARQRQDETMAPCDLNQIIRDALDLTRSRWRDDARAHGIVYDAIFRPSDSVIITCDQSAMREVFVNLIINSIDAMPSGGRLTVTTALERGDAVIIFEDTGCGMTDDVRQRIFEPFFTTKGPKGYGMGLAVSYGILGRHGGEIQVASEPEEGTIFTVRLPINREAPEGGSAENTALVLGARTASVLVVDDEASIRALLADVLRARGHKVLMAEDGIAGLRAIEGSRFDMVITDISMPGVDGWAVISEARRRSPETKLVVVTGYGGIVDQVVLGGDTDLVDALISKPFNLAEIDSTINDLLLEAQTRRSL